jgi:hypothetical protein
MAYYSALKTGIYHECRNCDVGNNIEKQHLKTGQPEGAVLCERCRTLKSEGKCVSGTPIPAT